MEALDGQQSAAASAPLLPKNGMVLGFDYGTKRLGIAVSDRDQRFASPLYNHQRQGLQGDERFLRRVLMEYRPVGFVVGLPLHMNGDESQKSQEARGFATWLTGLFGLPCEFQDERLTSWQAESLLLAAEFTKKQRKERMDKLAAQILLQAWLDRRRPAAPAAPEQTSEDAPAEQ